MERRSRECRRPQPQLNIVIEVAAFNTAVHLLRRQTVGRFCILPLYFFLFCCPDSNLADGRSARGQKYISVGTFLGLAQKIDSSE